MPRTWLGITLILISVGITFSQVRQNGFILFDDNVHLYENPYLSPPTMEKLKHLWTHSYFGLYIPVTYTAWAVESALGGYDSKRPDRWNPMPYHAVSLSLHALNSVLVFYLLLLLGGPWEGALFGTLLFSLHPTQVESVAWISSQKDLWCGLFSLLFLIRYIKKKGYLLPTLLFLLAILAKPSAVALILVVLVIELTLFQSRFRSFIRYLIPWCAISLVVILQTKELQPDSRAAVVTPFFLRHFIAGDALTFYLEKLFFPFNLALDYGRSPELLFNSPWAYTTWVLPVLLLILAYGYRSRLLWAVVGIFLATLLPVLGLLPFRFQQFSTVSDRYLYLSHLGPALGIALFWLRMAKTTDAEKKLRFLLVSLMLGMAGLSFNQVTYWKNNRSLFEHVLSINPQSLIAHNNLANTLEREGKLKAALSHYQKALSHRPDWLDLRYNVAGVQAKLHHYDAALRDLDFILTNDPTYADAYFIRGLIGADQGKFKDAEVDYRKALKIRPTNAKYLCKLGASLIHQGRLEEARDAFETSLALDSSISESENNLGVVWMRLKQLPLAISHFRNAIAMAPHYAEARVNLAACLDRTGNHREAASHYDYYMKLH